MAGAAVAWCINLVNFMDGADGLASTQALCVAMGMGLIATFGTVPNAQLAWLSAMLFACWAPLLWFNWPPAKLFMGDAGAIPLGFVLALIGLMAFLTDLSVGLAWLILMMPFLVDSGFTLCIRVLLGEPPHIAHRDHAYQRLIGQVGSPLPITLGLLGMQVIWQFPLAVTAVNSTVFPPLLVLLSAIPSVAAVVYARLRA
jgi:Fuc2NAc and GlcNAc transferase